MGWRQKKNRRFKDIYQKVKVKPEFQNHFIFLHLDIVFFLASPLRESKASLDPTAGLKIKGKLIFFDIRAEFIRYQSFLISQNATS